MLTFLLVAAMDDKNCTDMDLDSGPAFKRAKTTSESTVTASEASKDVVSHADEENRMTENRAGITEYMDRSIPGFDGIIKQRFTDFLVNEIDLKGTVCRIRSLNPPAGKYLNELLGVAPTPSASADAESAKAKDGVWPDDASTRLAEYFPDSSIELIRQMWETGRGPENFGTGANATTAAEPSATVTRALQDKAERTAVHKLIREVFSGKLATDSCNINAGKSSQVDADDDEDARANAAASTSMAISVRWANKSDRRAGDELPAEARESPPYIHFLLQKTNRDHQEAMQMLAQSLGLGTSGGSRGGRGGRGRGGFAGGAGRSPTKDLSVAGTKDKRAVTVQQVSLKRNRKTLDDVWRMVNGVSGKSNAKGRGGKTVKDAVSTRGDRGIRIAHLSYAKEGLKLGQLLGNEFTITLRNVRPTQPEHDVHSLIQKSMTTIREKGFINYYGMQRFGTGAIPTHHIGVLIFKNDFAGILATLFTPRLSSSPTSDDGDTADLLKAKQLYHSGEFEKAFFIVPKNCTAERAILDKMRRTNHTKGDLAGAFANIPRTLRLMYVHAYQSYVWNRLVSERLARFGSEHPVEGDIVFVDATLDELTTTSHELSETDDDDDARLNTAAVPKWQQATKVLTEQDLQSTSGRVWTIYDVVLPLPGSDIAVPSGWMSDLYTSILSADGLTHADLTSSKIPEYKLKGSYRRIIVKPTHFEHSTTTYTDPDLALTSTDEETCLNMSLQPDNAAVNADEFSSAPTFTALTLKFQLPSSSYATMLMREALKSDTSSFKHRQMTQHSEDQRFKGTSVTNTDFSPH